MLSESKYKNLNQFLTTKNSSSSKKVSINIRSETTSPSSYNERNYSTQNRPFYNDINNNNQVQCYFGIKKSNTIDKQFYNNINLLTNLKESEENIYDSFSKDVNKNNLNDTNKINIMSVSKNKNNAIYDKSLFIQIIKYYTRKTKNNIIKNDEVSNFLKPMKIFMNNQKKNVINIKNIKKELEEKNSSKILKKEINHYNSIKIDENNKNINNIFKMNTNENKNYIGIDDNFNLTFGKSSNKIELTSSNNNSNHYKNIKVKNTKKLNKNYKFNINNFKNNLGVIKRKKNNNKDNIDIGLQSQRNSDPPISLSGKFYNEDKKTKKIIDKNNNEENTASFLNKSNKKDEKINSNTAHQFKSKKFNLPKNAINIDSIKFNNHILQNLLSHKKKIGKNSKNNLENKNKQGERNLFDSSLFKAFDKKISMMEENKINKNINLNHFNRNYSGKKNIKNKNMNK